MSWVDAMRLRRRATIARAIGWVNLAITLIACVVEPQMLPFFATWAGGVMALSYGLAYAIEKRADRVVAR